MFFLPIKPLNFAIVFLMALGVVPATAASNAVKSFNVERYLGTWHEVARLPVFYQNGCKNSKAIYRRINATRFSVTNTCEQSGKTVSTKGQATQPRPGQFAVEFKRIITFRANYKVIWVDQNYRLAVVVVPNKQRAWILSRTRKAPKGLLNAALGAFEKSGLSKKNLIWN